MNSDEEDEVVAQLEHVTLVLCFIVLLREKKQNIPTAWAYYTVPNWIDDAVTCTRKWQLIRTKERVFVFSSAK